MKKTKKCKKSRKKFKKVLTLFYGFDILLVHLQKEAKAAEKKVQKNKKSC